MISRLGKQHLRCSIGRDEKNSKAHYFLEGRQDDETDAFAIPQNGYIILNTPLMLS